jgi:hypothetical protein
MLVAAHQGVQYRKQGIEQTDMNCMHQLVFLTNYLMYYVYLNMYIRELRC